MRIKTALKWVGIVLGGLVGLLVLAAIGVSFYMGAYLDRTFDIKGSAVTIPQDPASLEEGKRLATLRGCASGCHGENGRGQVFFELPGGSQMVAPNVVRAAQDWPIEDFERLVRHGVKPDGTSVILAMPSAMFSHLSDEDLGAMFAWFRSLDPGNDALPKTRLNLPGRLMMFYYKQLAETLLSADKIDHSAAPTPPGEGVSIQRGEYLAKTVCSECHGADLRGDTAFDMPDLVVAQAYPLEDFRHLMRTGEALGGRELALMTQVAQERFSHFTDEEVEALHGFLRTLAGQGGE